MIFGKFELGTPILGYEEINRNNVEVCSRNYGSLFEAMGPEKFAAFQNQETYMDEYVRPRIVDSLLKFEGSIVGSQEYVKNGQVVNSIFVEQDVGNGTKCVFVVDTNKSGQGMYKLDNLYIIGGRGATIDLLEEVDSEVESFLIPSMNAAFEPRTGTLYFGDLKRIGKAMGYEPNVSVYFHEVGHYKDWRKNKGAFDEFMHFPKKQLIQTSLINILRSVSTGDEQIEKVANLMGKGVLTNFFDYMNLLLKMENSATSFARVLVVDKRDNGVDLIPGQPGGKFSEILNYAYSTYESFFSLEYPDRIKVEYENLKLVDDQKITFEQRMTEIMNIIKMYRRVIDNNKI